MAFTIKQVKQFINEEIKEHLMEDFFGITPASKQLKITKKNLENAKHYLNIVTTIFNKIDLEYSETGQFSPPLIEECEVYSRQLKDMIIAYEKSLKDLSNKIE